MFNAEEFLNQTVAAPLATQYVAIPEGEYRCLVSTEGEVKDWFREVKFNDKKTGAERTMQTCEIPIEILDDGVRQKLGRDTITTRYRIVLDLTPDGKLDTSEGKNVKLGQLRAAVGQNDDPTWTFTKLRGAGPFMGKVTQSSDKNDPEKKYSEVAKVTRLA